MKAKLINTGEVVEVYRTVAGWVSENQNKIRVFEESELDFDYCEWEAFRREAAKEILCALIIHCSLPREDGARIAIEYADELIKQLKDKSNESTR